MKHEYDKILTRLTVILQRLYEGETLYVGALAEEFNVGTRTIQRDFNERLSALLSMPVWAAKAQKRYTLNRCCVAGLQYHPGISLRLQAGDALKMVREPDNPYDANAVALYAGDTKLGYIPKKENTTTAMLLDQNAVLAARVERFDAGAKSWERVKIAVEQVG